MPAGEVDVLAGLHEIPAQLAEHVRTLALIDHHVHGCFVDEIDRATFEESINEGSPCPIPNFMTQFDSQLGLAIRRWCAPVLGLEAHSTAEQYWNERSALGSADLTRRLLHPTKVEHWVVDTGYSSRPITTPAELATAAGGAASEIVRLEPLAESLVASGVTPADFPEEYRAALMTATLGAKGCKTIVAYRTGFDIDWNRPTDQAVIAAVQRWTANGISDLRLADPVLEAFVVHAAFELQRPLQVHVGFGDRDLDLHRTDPLLLLDLLRQPRAADTPIMLLHCYPFHRQAGYLAQAFDNVYFDIGLSINYVGAQSPQLIAESLELVPFSKQLYSSDAYGLPELHLLGELLWRRGMAEVLGRFVQRNDWSETDAIRVLRMIGADNARRVYEL